MQNKSLSILCAAKSSARSPREFISECKCQLISGNVASPFWIRLSFFCIHSCITVDVLHQLYQGIIKYLITWCSSLMSEAELDQWFQTLPQCFGVHHFKHGWSNLSQVSGNKQKQMARVLLGCLVGKVPNDILTCYRSLLDFLQSWPSTLHMTTSPSNIWKRLFRFSTITRTSSSPLGSGTTSTSLSFTSAPLRGVHQIIWDD